MGVEIERKFLVSGDQWRRQAAAPVTIRQGYLSVDPERAVRVRIQDNRAILTIKGRVTDIVRHEWEYEIPVTDAEQILDHLCPHAPIVKLRYRVPIGSKTWEIDCFEGENAGLTLAEVELNRPDEPVTLPDWIGEEVTSDPRYLNVNLARSPWSRWGAAADGKKRSGT